MSTTSPGQPEPGLGTTEFWTSLLTSLLSLGVGVATLVGSDFDPTGAQALIPAAATLAAAISAAVYTHSRASLKGTVRTAQAAALQDSLAWPTAEEIGVRTR
jgi:hypothetical protein